MARKNTKPSPDATQPPAGLPTVSPRGVGLEVLGPEDLIIPRLVLVQATSQIEGVMAGKFYLNLTGDQFDEVQAVFLKVLKGRVYFAEDANERKPLCGSPDRSKPSPRYEHPVAPTCGECAYAPWRGKEPPV